jgi:anti-sigma B factor antagonist
MDSSIRRTRADDGTATVSVRGEVDHSNADELAECIRDAVGDRSPALVLVDVKDVSFIDSTGLGALIDGFRASGAAGARFVVANPTPAFHRVLTVTGLSGFFGLSEPGEIDSGSTSEATGS